MKEMPSKMSSLPFNNFIQVIGSPPLLGQIRQFRVERRIVGETSLVFVTSVLCLLQALQLRLHGGGEAKGSAEDHGGALPLGVLTGQSSCAQLLQFLLFLLLPFSQDSRTRNNLPTLDFVMTFDNRRFWSPRRLLKVKM